MRSTPLLMAAALLSAVPTLAQQSSTSTKMGVEQPSAVAVPNELTVQGCFSSPGELKSMGVLSYNSESKCAQDTCLAQGFAVAATTAGSECYCGNEYPPQAAVANDTHCNTPCTGYGQNACQCNTRRPRFLAAMALTGSLSLQVAVTSSGPSTTRA